MDGWLARLADLRAAAPRDGLMMQEMHGEDGWLAGWLDGWLAGRMDGWLVGWMDDWLAGWMDGRHIG